MGSAVRVDMADRMLLGEVRYCYRESDERFAVGLENQQVLDNVSDLRHLMDAIMGNQREPREAKAPALALVRKRKNV